MINIRRVLPRAVDAHLKVAIIRASAPKSAYELARTARVPVWMARQRLDRWVDAGLVARLTGVGSGPALYMWCR